MLKERMKTEIEKVGAQDFCTDELSVGLIFCSYSQLRCLLLSMQELCDVFSLCLPFSWFLLPAIVPATFCLCRVLCGEIGGRGWHTAQQWSFLFDVVASLQTEGITAGVSGIAARWPGGAAVVSCCLVPFEL